MADGSENGQESQEPVDWELARKRSADALWGIYIGACRIHREMKAGGGNGAARGSATGTSQGKVSVI